jgi:hypothetical protein
MIKNWGGSHYGLFQGITNTKLNRTLCGWVRVPSQTKAITIFFSQPVICEKI